MRPILIALALLAITAPAAEATTYAAAGQHLDTSHAVRHARNVAERYWHGRGVEPCAQPLIYTAPSLGTSLELERAEQPGCSVWLLGWIAADAVQTRLGARILCRVMIHALGHTAGLGHAAHGVMSPEIDLSRPIRGPRVCSRERRSEVRPGP